MKKIIAAQAWSYASPRRIAVTLFAWGLFFAASANAGNAVAATSASMCNITALERSDRIIKAILKDPSANYTQAGGGGISEIRQLSTDVFRVSLPQEERVDLLTYHLSVDGKCDITISKKEVSASSH